MPSEGQEWLVGNTAARTIPTATPPFMPRQYTTQNLIVTETNSEKIDDNEEGKENEEEIKTKKRKPKIKLRKRVGCRQQ